MSELLYFFETENERESHKKVCESNDFCNVVMSFEDTKILNFNQYQKSDKYQKSNKASFVIYADLEFLIEKIDGCKNDSENSFATKVDKHILSDFSISTTSSFKNIENKDDAMKITNSK